MSIITVNGTQYEVTGNRSLLRFLRDDLHLTSVKDGCSEGACGTCHVLINGVPTKACAPKLSQLDGKEIITVEGLTPEEKEIYTYAFGKCGAVQCGFCIPGMVISAKGLLDKNPSPSRDEAAYAIRNNICRCTGYKKIIDAILMAAEIKRNGGVIPEETEPNRVGSSMIRIDVREKVLGYGQYPDDVYLDGMIYGSAVRTKYPRARVLAIHTEKAKALPGVVCVLTADDIPEGGSYKVGHLKQDVDALTPVGKITHFLGDAVALVAAESQEILEKAKKLVEVEYEELPMVTDPKNAARPDAPLVHESGNLLVEKHVSRGNADEAIARSKYVLSDHFETPITEHAFLEPECAVAYPAEDGGVTVLSTDQGTYATQHETMHLLGLPEDKVHIINMLVGGGFGGKEDVTVQHHAAFIAYVTKRPVKVKLTRQESILIHPKRHPMKVDMTMGVDENGIIQGVKAEVISDTGAYASLGAPVLERACTHASGPYHYENFEITGRAYYTNNPPAGAFRGFGVTQTVFATELLLTRLAEMVGITPWEIRYRNAIRPGEVLPNGQIVDESTGLVETLEAVKEIYDANPGAGIACAMKNAGVGVGLPDYGRCILAIEDGKIHIRAGASCIGQGLGTVLTQICGTMLGCESSDVVYERSNTVNAPESGDTSGSRQTLVTGEAVRRACMKIKNAVLETGKDYEFGDWKKLEGQEFFAEYFAKTDPLNAPLENPVSHVAYGYATQVCILDDNGYVKEIVAAHDVGTAINPLSIEGQIEGGVVMSMGLTLSEMYPLVDCVPTAKYGTLGLLRAHQVPKITPLIVEKKGFDMACGAIGIGEITSIPTAPAIAAAYYHRDGFYRTRIPVYKTPYERPDMPRYWEN